MFHSSSVTLWQDQYVTINATWYGGLKWKPVQDPSGVRKKTLYWSAERSGQPRYDTRTTFWHCVWSDCSLPCELDFLYYQKVTMSVPVGGCKEKYFVGVERLPLHQKRHIWHVLIVQEVRIWKSHGQKYLIFIRCTVRGNNHVLISVKNSATFRVLYFVLCTFSPYLWTLEGSMGIPPILCIYCRQSTLSTSEGFLRPVYYPCSQNNDSSVSHWHWERNLWHCNTCNVNMH